MIHWSREEDGRYYTAFICRDILNDWTVVKAWGGKGKPKGQVRMIRCRDVDEAISVLAQITMRRKKRGYKIDEIDSLYGRFGCESANK